MGKSMASKKAAQTSTQCEVCQATIWVRGRERRRWCGPFCRVKAGRATSSDRRAVLHYDNHERPTTAIHEAGHAIFAMTMGWKITSVDLHTSGHQLGLTVYDRSGASEGSLLDEAACSLAGHVAERAFIGESGAQHALALMYDVEEFDSDCDDALQAAFDALPVPKDRADEHAQEQLVRDFLERAAARAEDVLRSRMSDLGLIAAALSQYGRLTPAALEILLAPEVEPSPQLGD